MTSRSDTAALKADIDRTQGFLRAAKDRLAEMSKKEKP